MTKIKSIGAPTYGAHWSMGPRFMQQISKSNAARLCGMYPLPKMGCEVGCAFVKNVVGGFDRLMVQNISGSFFVACGSVSIDYWPDTFHVEILEPKS